MLAVLVLLRRHIYEANNLCLQAYGLSVQVAMKVGGIPISRNRMTVVDKFQQLGKTGGCPQSAALHSILDSQIRSREATT
jgi:hypothetical protein